MYLVKWIDPAVTDGQSLKVVEYLACRDVFVVFQDSLAKVGYICACETLSRKVQLYK